MKDKENRWSSFKNIAASSATSPARNHGLPSPEQWTQPGTDYQYLTIPGSMHSFSYWNSWDGQPCIGPCNTVAHDVIAFLKAQAGLP